MITIPKLTSRWSWPIATIPFVVSGAVGIYYLVTDPKDRVWVVVGIPLLWLCLIALLAQSMRLDSQSGRLLTTRLWMFKRVLDLDQASKVGIAGNGANGVMLGVRSGKLPMYVPLLQLSDTIKRSQDAPVLSTLADTVERHVPAEVRGDVVEQLRAQAQHMASGGAPADSPFAPLVNAKLLKAGGAAGATATIFDLLK